MYDALIIPLKEIAVLDALACISHNSLCIFHYKIYIVYLCCTLTALVLFTLKLFVVQPLINYLIKQSISKLAKRGFDIMLYFVALRSNNTILSFDKK